MDPRRSRFPRCRRARRVVTREVQRRFRGLPLRRDAPRDAGGCSPDGRQHHRGVHRGGPQGARRFRRRRRGHRADRDRQGDHRR